VTSYGSVPVQDTYDVDVIAAATLACPAVARLHAGGPRVVATYLPGRRVDGVRIEDDRVLVSVVLVYGAPVGSLDRQVRAALAPHVKGRSVDVHVADVQPAEDVSRGEARG
jgi:hypothetical protein